MAHCGYEATAVTDALRHPLKALRVAARPIETDGPMAPEIPLAHQRPAEYLFEHIVRSEVDKAPRKPERRSDKQNDAA